MHSHHLHRNGLAFALSFLAGLYFLLEPSIWSALLPFGVGVPAFCVAPRRIRAWTLLGLCLGVGYGALAWQGLHALDGEIGREGVWQGEVRAVQGDGRRLEVALDGAGLAPASRIEVWRAWGDETPILPGSQVRLRGKMRAPEGPRNPGGYDEARILFGRGIGQVVRAHGPVELDAPPGRLGLALAREQEAIAQRLSRGLGAPRDALAEAMLLGRRAALSEAFYHRAQLLGIVHLFAVSGLHVGFLLAALYWPLRVLMPGRGKAYLALAVAVLVGYALLVGGGPAVLRATVMALVGLWCLSAARYRDPLTIVAWAAMALVVIHPFALWQLGFRLSFAVTLAILFVAPALERTLWRLPEGLAKALAIGIAAEWASLPLIAWTFHYLAPMGIVVNLLVVPLAGVLLPALIIALALDVLWAPLARPLYWLVGRGLDLLIYLVSEPGALWARWHWHLGMASPLAYALVAAILVAVALEWPQGWLSRRRRPMALVLLLLPLSMLVLVRAPAKDLALTVIDVGQGQAVLWQTEEGARYLFDCGINPESAAAPLRALGVNRLDGLVISHADLDHAGGTARILSDFRVKRLYVLPETWADPRLADAHRALGRTEVAPLTAPVRLPLGRETLTLLPMHAGEGNNEAQLVARIDGPTSVLIPGDLAASGMAELAKAPSPMVLLLAHHGSKNSLLPDGFAHFRPGLAIASCGRDNRYGHPHPEVRRALADAHVPFYSTADSGALFCYRRDGAYELRCWL